MKNSVEIKLIWNGVAYSKGSYVSDKNVKNKLEWLVDSCLNTFEEIKKRNSHAKI
jgi:hypothetical protein